MKIVENIKCPENDHFLNTQILKNIAHSMSNYLMVVQNIYYLLF